MFRMKLTLLICCVLALVSNHLVPQLPIFIASFYSDRNLF